MVTVYGQKHCQGCRATHRKLETMGVAYEAIDVGEDHDARNYLIGLGATTTPVVVTGSGWWEGYRPDQLAML